MIYFVQAVESKRIKIGYTAGDAAARMADLQTGSPEPLRLIGVIPGEMADESLLHEVYAKYRLRGEWFHPHPELTRFIAIACPVPDHRLLPGDASYQRGFLDALKWAHDAIPTMRPEVFARRVWDATGLIDTEYHEGIECSSAAEFRATFDRFLDMISPIPQES